LSSSRSFKRCIAVSQEGLLHRPADDQRRDGRRRSHLLLHGGERSGPTTRCRPTRRRRSHLHGRRHRDRRQRPRPRRRLSGGTGLRAAPQAVLLLPGSPRPLPAGGYCADRASEGGDGGGGKQFRGGQQQQRRRGAAGQQGGLTSQPQRQARYRS
jgi:hypothetical protein